MRRLVVITSLVIAGGMSAQDFTSSDIADAAERQTKRRAHMSHDVRLLSGSSMAGPAVTLRIVRDDSASSMGEGLKAIQVIEAAKPGSVIVITVEGEKDFAIFGATFATLAMSRKLAGFVVDGTMRGLDEFRHLGFPMFARGTVSGSAGGHYRLEAANVPILCGGVEVAPGDLVVGDADGVAVAPKALETAIVAKARELRREKEALLPLIAKHTSYTEAVKAQKAAKDH